ncbi:hypothetical protein ACFWIO_02100 [Streptomyces diastatochromogenes]|uniref:hypothetical protein n=1 Tax=Streptomyces diastatochromogenes TaxID=42236 RepID=UPI00364ADA1F
MRRVLKLLAMTMLALGIGVTPALAQNPHFIGAPTCSGKTVSGSTVTISCSGKVAGLGSQKVAVFLTAGQVDLQLICVNKGGNTAPGHPAFFQGVTGPTKTITPHNGQITFTATLSVTAPSSREVCPNGNWRVVITSASFDNVVLHVEQPPGTEVLHWDFPHIDP